jgi:RNA recognition motif-containing protein
MNSATELNVTFPPSVGDNRCKIFLSNLDGRINTQELYTFFSPFGTIEHIESWTPKSAIVLFSDIESIDRVLAKHRRCTINKQDIFIRRFRYGYIERAYMDSAVLFVKARRTDLPLKWSERIIRQCFLDYELQIEQIQLVPESFEAFVYFKDYDTVDRVLVEKNSFHVDGVKLDIKRAKCNEKPLDEQELYVRRLVKENKVLKRLMERKI